MATALNTKYRNFFLFALVFVLAFSVSTSLAKRRGFLSDESSYFSIIQSLAHDGDLEYTRQDIQRIRRHFYTGPLGLFLKKAENGRLYFAKSFAYPLAAAPFFRLFGQNGLLLFNGLMILSCLWMGYLLLRKHHEESSSLRFSLVFVLASVVPVYIWWVTADLFNFFVVFAGLFFFFYPFQRKGWFYLSGLFFSFAVFSKPNTALPIAILYLIPLFQRDWKRFLALCLITVMICSLLLGFLYAQTGGINFMGGERRTFYSHYPFEMPEYRFENGFKMTADNYWERFYLSPKIVALNLFYFVFGRFTGMFIYTFPALFILLLFLFQKRAREDWLILAAITAGILFFILVTPDNYFGGSGSVGNRYLLSILPFFFFLGYRHRPMRLTWVPLLVGLVFLPGLFMDAVHHSTYSRSAGMSFPINLFPPEKTQYQALQANENPRAFGRLVRDRQGRYTVHFLNDNNWPLEENTFWTNGTSPAELFAVMPGPVRNFRIKLKNIPKENHVVLQVEHLRREFRLQPNQEVMVNVDCRRHHISGLAMKQRQVYYFRIRSLKEFCPFFADSTKEDRRNLGVQVHIGFEQ